MKSLLVNFQKFFRGKTTILTVNSVVFTYKMEKKHFIFAHMKILCNKNITHF